MRKRYLIDCKRQSKGQHVRLGMAEEEKAEFEKVLEEAIASVFSRI
jgi:hypothetical protein